jgi:RNA polymerase sigma factor (sigma-70 family)
MPRSALLATSETSEFQDFLEAVRPKLRRLLISSKVPLEDAEDVTQDALIALVRRGDQIGGLRSREAWLIGTLRKTICLYWRRRQRERRLLTVFSREIGSTEEAPQERQDAARDLEAIIRKLKSRDRQLLWLRYGLELKPRESADALGCDPGSVLRLSQRALSRARRNLALAPPVDRPFGPAIASIQPEKEKP